jgi:hypothetical protein
MRKITLVVGVVCALAGCDQTGHVTAVAPTSYHDVAYYDAHPLERSQTRAWCRDNPGLTAKVPSCDSAGTSDRDAWHRQMGWQ